MLKIKTYPELSGVQSVNSLDIVSARNAKKSLSGVQSVNSFEIVSTRYAKYLSCIAMLGMVNNGLTHINALYCMPTSF